jgi:putative transposase
VKPIKLPAQSPDLNAFAERFVLSIKSECLDRLIPLGERHLRRAITEFVEHYHAERNHQGLGNRLVTEAVEPKTPVNENAPIAHRQRLGGLLNFYYRGTA